MCDTESPWQYNLNVSNVTNILLPQDMNPFKLSLFRYHQKGFCKAGAFSGAFTITEIITQHSVLIVTTEENTFLIGNHIRLTLNPTVKALWEANSFPVNLD